MPIMSIVMTKVSESLFFFCGGGYKMKLLWVVSENIKLNLPNKKDF